MDANQEALRSKQAYNEGEQFTQANEARKKQAGLEQQAAQQGAEAQQVAGAEQERYNKFDPEAYARAQTDAAGAMQAYQARRMGANAGKAARLGNFGLQQAQANAMGQGLGMKSQMGQQAYGMRAGQQGQLGQFGAQKGQEAIARTGLQQGFMQGEQQSLGQQEQQRQAISNTVGNVAGTVGKMAGLPMEKGGEAKAGTQYLVGEKGPEMIVPKNDSVIIPANITKELSEHGKKLMKEFIDDTFKFYKKVK